MIKYISKLWTNDNKKDIQVLITDRQIEILYSEMMNNKNITGFIIYAERLGV